MASTDTQETLTEPSAVTEQAAERPTARDAEPTGKLPPRVWLLLGLIVLFGLTIRLMAFAGYQGHDDRSYVSYAYAFASEGRVGAEHMRAWLGRIGHWLPMALAMRLGGFAEWTLAVYPLICSILHIVMAFAVGWLLFSPTVGLGAAFLLSFLPLEVILASYPYVDVPCGLFMSATLFFFLLGERRGSNWPYLAAGLCAGVAYLTKETAVFLLVPFAAYCVMLRTFKRQYLLVVAGGLAMIACELAFWHAYTGNPLHRYAALASHDKAPEGAGAAAQERAKENTVRAKRGGGFWGEPIVMFATNQEFGLYYFLIWPICLYMLFRGSPPARILAIWMLGLGLVMCYLPRLDLTQLLNRNPRYFTCLSVPGTVLLAYVLWQARPTLRWSVVGLLLVTSLFCVYIDGSRVHLNNERQLMAFHRQHPEETLWVHPEVAVYFSVASRFQPDPNVKVHLLSCTPEADALANIRLMHPEMAVAERPSEIDSGYVALRPGKGPPDVHKWPLAASIATKRGESIRSLQRFLSRIGVPKRYVKKLSPSSGRNFKVWQVPQTETAAAL